MATGIEVAGLVLGALPLVLAGLQSYADGIAVSRRFRMFDLEVKALKTDVMTENARYRNSIELLLIGLVHPRDMSAFLADAGGDLWKEEGFNQRLRERLGKSYDAYMSTVAQLHITIQALEDRLKLPKNNKVS